MPDYRVTVVDSPKSALKTAIEWAQLALTGAISKRDRKLNKELTEGIQKLQAAQSILESDNGHTS